MKLTRQENWHVKAFPGWSDGFDSCKHIVNEIEKHCESVDRTEIDCDTIEYCEFCKNNWEEDPCTGEPLCCEMAVVDLERSQYCYQCFQRTARLFKREGDNYSQRHEAIRCERCKRWFCWECFKWQQRGLCKDCQEEVEKLKQEEEFRRKQRGIRRVVP